MVIVASVSASLFASFYRERLAVAVGSGRHWFGDPIAGLERAQSHQTHR